MNKNVLITIYENVKNFLEVFHYHLDSKWYKKN